MASPPQTPITLTVSNLNAATNFYLSALRSLGYQYQSKVQDHTASASSTAVGIGPSNTTRVDLFLSEPGSASRDRRRKPAHAHVVFPASSRDAVRDFYSAALDAGGRPVSPPDAIDAGRGPFSATIQDVDGNKVEVCCLDSIAQDRPAPRGGERSRAVAPPANNATPDRREHVPDHYPAGTMRGNSMPRDGIPAGAAAAAPPPYPPASAPRARSPSPGPPRKPSSIKGSSSNSGENSSGKAVVGTLLGAAAGAAVVYAFTKETSDSKAKDAKFDGPRRDGRARLEDEARQRAYALAWREKAAASRRQRADRDSGYYSERREASLDRRPRYRTITYPQQGRRGSSLDGRESIASSRASRSSRTAKPVDEGPAPPPQRTLSYRPRTVRRYIPVSPPSPPSPQRAAGRREKDDYQDGGDRGVVDDESDFDGLDDETVVPDDSISVAPADAPSHKVERRRERRRQSPPSPRRRRPDVAVY